MTGGEARAYYSLGPQWTDIFLVEAFPQCPHSVLRALAAVK
jgi:hypothetical protein